MTKKNTTCDPKQVERCTAELRTVLTALALQHTAMMLFAALMEHVGGGLAIAQHARACTPSAVRAIMDRLRAVAFSA